MLIFCSLRGQQVLLYRILKALNVDMEVYLAHLRVTEKRELVKDFDMTARPQILTGSYAITSCGLNLPKDAMLWIFGPSSLERCR